MSESESAQLHDPRLQELVDHARDCYQDGNLDESRRLLELANSHACSWGSGNHTDLTTIRANLAVVMKEMGDLTGAHAILEEVHTAWSQTRPAEDPDLIAIRVHLAETRKERDDLTGALALEEKVHAALSQILPAEHPELMAFCVTMAGTRSRLLDLSGALTLVELVHEVWSRTLPAEHPDLMKVRENLGTTRARLGDLAAGYALLEEVHAVWSRQLPAEHPDLMSIRMNLAVTREELGDLTGALALLEEVHAVLSRQLPAEHPDLMRARENLAITRARLGNLYGALKLQEKVDEVRSRTLPTEHPDLIRTRMNLAVTRRRLGDFSGALALEEKVHEVWSRTLPAEHPSLTLIRMNLAVTRANLGDFSGALALEEEVHEVWSRTLPAEHPDLMGVKANLAATRKQLGDVSGALWLEEKVHEVWSRTLPAYHPDLGLIRNNLANTYEMLGKRGESRRLRSKSLAGQRQLDVLQLSILSPESHTNARTTLSRTVELLLGVRDPGAPPEACTHEEFLAALAGRGLAEHWSYASARLRDVIVCNEKLNSLAAVADRNRRSHDESLRSGAGVIGALQALEAAQQTFRGEAMKLPSLAAALEPPDPGKYVSLLPPDSCLVLIQPYTVVGTNGSDSHHLAAFVADRSGRASRINIGLVSEVDYDVDHFLEFLVPGASGEPAGTYPDPLAGLLLGRLRPIIAAIPEGTTDLYVLPAGPLAAIPWDALWSGSEYLGDRYRVHYVEGLAGLQSKGPVASPPSLLAVGDVNFGPGTAQIALEPLKSTTAEINLILAEYRACWGINETSLTKAEATRQKFLDEAPRHRFLHVATHGVVVDDAENIVGSFGQFGVTHGSSNEAYRIRDRNQFQGLALAGVNHDTLGPWNRGLVTAADVLRLDLSGCELVNLSACETNVGPRHQGEALAGMARAFLVAGARSVLASFWSVEDAGTAWFQQRFYEALWGGEGRSPEEALREARRRARAAGYGPSVWAAFALYTAGRLSRPTTPSIASEG